MSQASDGRLSSLPALQIRTDDPAAHAKVCETIGAGSLVVDGADHGLVVRGSVRATCEGFRALAEASLAFVARRASSRLGRPQCGGARSQGVQASHVPEIRWGYTTLCTELSGDFLALERSRAVDRRSWR